MRDVAHRAVRIIRHRHKLLRGVLPRQDSLRREDSQIGHARRILGIVRRALANPLKNRSILQRIGGESKAAAVRRLRGGLGQNQALLRRRLVDSRVDRLIIQCRFVTKER